MEPNYRIAERRLKDKLTKEDKRALTPLIYVNPYSWNTQIKQITGHRVLFIYTAATTMIIYLTV